MRFALRGGVLRNLVLQPRETSLSSLYDLVDPFSDIDLVVEGESEWTQLAQGIAESIPFAGFHRWEAETEEAMRATSKRFGMIPADRLILWFDGRTGKQPKVNVEGLDVKHEDVLQNPSITVELGWAKNQEHFNVLDRLLDALRFARYVFAFPSSRGVAEPADLLKSLQLRATPPPHVGVEQFSRHIRRLELAILDLVFTAARWPDISGFLDLCREEISPLWLESSPLLSRIFYQSALRAGTGIGAVLYKPGPASGLRKLLFNDLGPAPKSLSGLGSVIPWVKLRSSGHKADDCCGYTDFQNGVASVAWRGKNHGMDFSQLEGSDFATVASPLNSAAIYRGHPVSSERQVISIPGFVRKGRSLVIRVDHGYIRSFMNRNADFHLGLVQSKQ
jgi:hypothetical protein